MKIKLTNTTIYSWENVRINYAKITIINKFLYKLQMLYYDRIGIFEGIAFNKISSLGKKLFGVIIDDELTFKSHICNMLKKADQKLNALT